MSQLSRSSFGTASQKQISVHSKAITKASYSIHNDKPNLRSIIEESQSGYHHRPSHLSRVPRVAPAAPTALSFLDRSETFSVKPFSRPTNTFETQSLFF